MMKVRLGLSIQILLGLVAGCVVGVFFPSLGLHFKFLSDLFLRLVKMLIIPLLLATLVSGLSSGGGFRKVGRVGLSGLAYFAAVTLLAFTLGSVIALLFQPGVTAVTSSAVGGQENLSKGTGPTLREMVVNLVPDSVVEAMAHNNILQVVVFSLFLGVGISHAGAAAESLSRLFSELARVMFLVTGFVMRFAPVGVFAALAYSLSKEGFGVLFVLMRLVLTVYLGLLVLVFGVFFVVALVFRIPFGSFLRVAATPFFLAFSTCTSQTALPRALENMQRFGVSREIVSFVLPLGYSFNLAGSYVYQVVALFFLIQYYRFPLAGSEILMLLLVLMVASKGIATVPRGSLVVLAATLTTFQLPLEGIALILAADQFMDMPRTGANVIGNCLASAVVARTTGDLRLRTNEV